MKRIAFFVFITIFIAVSSYAVVRIVTVKGPYNSCRITEANENISTYHSGGAGSLPGGADPDYDDLAVWEAATDYDLVSANATEVLEVYSGIHDDSIQVSGATTNQNCRRIIRAASGHRHNGIPGTGAQFASSSAQFLFDIRESHAQVQDLDLSNNWGHSTQYPAGIIVTVGDVYIIGCIIHDVQNSGTGLGGMGIIEGTLAHNTSTYYINNIIYNCESRGFNVGNVYNDTHIYLFNNTVYACDYGVRMDYNGNIHATNVISVANRVDDWYTAGWGSGSIIKTTSTSEGADTTGWFRDAASGNLHLHHPDSAGVGTDLSADPNFSFDDDIDGLWRRGQWSIGADQRN